MFVCQIEQEMHNGAICIDQNRFHPTIDCYEFCHFLTFFYPLRELESKTKIYSISPYSFLTKTSIVTSVCGLVKIVTDFQKNRLKIFRTRSRNLKSNHRWPSSCHRPRLSRYRHETEFLSEYHWFSILTTKTIFVGMWNVFIRYLGR